MGHRLLVFFFCCACSTTVCAGLPVVGGSALEPVSTDYELCDGPAWSGGSLFVPDVRAQKLFRYNPRTKKRTLLLEGKGRFSASYFNHGSLYLSDNGGARIVRLDGNELTSVAAQDPKAKPPARPNDLVVDRRGAIYYTLTGPGEVIHVSPSGKQSVAAKVNSPNGIALSPDNQTLYVAAYRPKKIWAYDIGEDGGLTKAREFAAMDDGEALGADGMTTDRAGNVYCVGATDVWIWSPDGELITKIKTPTRPINCAFGDADMQSLYITCFGGLYRQRMNVSGVSPQPVDRPSVAVPTLKLPENVAVHLDVTYAEYGSRKLLADIFVPQGQGDKLPTIVVVHGGGWLKGDKTKFRALAQSLAARGYVTAAIEYRLGGEALFPAAIHDCNAAVRFLRANAKQYSIDPGRIGGVGGSAGGHLVGLMAAAPHVDKLQGDGGHAEQSSRLQAAIVMAGPLQMATGSVAERSRKQPDKSNSNRWLGKTVDEAPDLYKLAAPYRHFTKQTPPLLFMTGEHDNPERNAPSREKLKSLGVWTDVKIYADGKHGCWNRLPWFVNMVDDMDTYFAVHLKRSE